MVPDAPSASRRPFGASIEARRGVTTGISARDRATTIRAAMARDAGPDDLVMPGHVFPIVGREGGVLVRAGLTEASIDLVAPRRSRAGRGRVRHPARRRDAWRSAADLEALAELFELKIVAHSRPGRLPAAHRVARASRRRAHDRRRAAAGASAPSSTATTSIGTSTSRW